MAPLVGMAKAPPLYFLITVQKLCRSKKLAGLKRWVIVDVFVHLGLKTCGVLGVFSFSDLLEEWTAACEGWGLLCLLFARCSDRRFCFHSSIASLRLNFR